MFEHLQLGSLNFKKDAYILLEGKETTGVFFIIQQGKVRLSREVEAVADEQGSILGPGDFLGVVSTMSSHNHIETAQTLTDTALISIRKDQYGALIQNNLPVAMKILVQFSQRIRTLEEALTRITQKDAAAADPSHLFDVGEFYAAQNRFNLAYYAYHQYLKRCPQGSQAGEARKRMMKIALYTKGLKLSFGPEETRRLYPRDTMIFSELEQGEELYIILKGMVKLVKIVDDRELLLEILKEGDVFGEMALLEAQSQQTSAVAYEDCEVLAIHRENLERMVKTQPQLILRLTTLLAERIWFTYKQLANTLVTDPLGRMCDSLLIHLEKNRVPLNQNGSYVFDFGPQELLNMTGLSGSDGVEELRKLLKNRWINVLHDKIRVEDASEIQRQCEGFRREAKKALKAPASGDWSSGL